MIDTFVIFGAAGDLANRLVLPAVAAVAGSARVIGADARGDQWQRVDVTDSASVAAVLDGAGGDAVAVYLALPTQLMLPAVRALAAYDLPPGSRVAIEKPFGWDTASAVALNAACAALPDVYRVDHFLAMTEVQRLPSLVPSGEHEQVDLLFDETLALEGRASFYDRAGALRDVMQNHLVQVLCTLLAEPGPDIARSRANVLRAVRPVDVGATRRARYDGYLAEPGVDAANDTETFAEVTLRLDLPRWADTRFVLRAGKALGARRRGVLFHARSGSSPHWVEFDVPEPSGVPAEPRAYQRIVADLLAGGSAYAVSGEEAELAWHVFDPVLSAWAAGEVPMKTYPVGSSGPADVRPDS